MQIMPLSALPGRFQPQTLPSWARSLVTPRRRPIPPGLRNPLASLDALVFVLYATVLAFAVPHHLAGDDEAQAWLLARDNSLHDLLLRRMHYEGAPGLWNSLLWLAVRLHLPFSSLSWIGATFACAGVLLLLFRSPFPPIVRWLLPFTFFFAYQYAVIARPYTLFAALLFLLCILFTQSPPRPILFALTAGVLVNIGLHAAILSGMFALVYLHRLRATRLRAGTPLWTPRLVLAIALFLVFACASVAVAIPAADVVIAGNPTKTVAKPTSFLARLIPPERLPQGAPPLDPALDLASVENRERAARNGGVVPAPAPKPVLILFRTVLFGLDAATFPVARSNILNLLFFTSLFAWLRQRHALGFAIPWAAALVLSSQVLILDHHTGQFAIALVAAAWLALEAPPANASHLTLPDVALTATTLLILLLQIGWTFHAIAYERTHPYDPGRATAEFLRSNFPAKRIAGFSYESVTTEANSPTQLFFNQPAAYWIWSGNTYPDLRRTEARLAHPDVVVQAEMIKGDESPYNQWGHLWKPGERPYQPILDDWLAHGYHLTHRFCGDRVMRLGIADTLCEDILEPNAAP